MLGAIYGDKSGSIYEFNQLKEIKSIYPNKLILPNSFYSDDTIETIAVIDAILNKKDYETTLKEYIIKNRTYNPNINIPHFKSPFSPSTLKWAFGDKNNTSTHNGAMMRISPVGYLFNTEKDIVKHAKLVTSTSHNSNEAIEASCIIALMIFYFRNGLTKNEVYKKLNLLIKYEPFLKFNITCKETLNNCLYAIYMSSSFEEAIRLTLSMGGDTDTNCCIVGSVAEALYGMTVSQKEEAMYDLPKDYIKLLKRVYK